MMCEQVGDGRLVEGLRTGFGAQKGLDTRDSLTLAGILDRIRGGSAGRAKGGAGDPSTSSGIGLLAQGSDFCG